MASESEPHAPANSRSPAHQRGADGADLVRAALDFLRGIQPSGGEVSGPPSLARQKENLRQWADSLGLLLSFSNFPSKTVRGGTGALFVYPLMRVHSSHSITFQTHELLQRNLWQETRFRIHIVRARWRTHHRLRQAR